MMENLFIEKYCHIKNNKVFVDGKLAFAGEETDGLKSFLKSLYRFLKPSYNKFFKMDEISKLGFLATEFLLEDVDISKYEEDVALIFSNSDSTLITDTKHQESIDEDDNFFPSPSVFVYTLPNIMMGEISIRHKLKGENTFFIVENFNAELLTNHINNLFLTNKAKAFIGGWVNLNFHSYEAFLYLVSKDGSAIHSAEEINRIYTNIEE